ncbi:hypothetical protein E24_00363 [Faustovirus]|nr:hypothetical protein PRJ_Fausto_00341 [Faustovirus]AMN83279.1 hypothetical protein E24_00363 [Faustovirus]AMN84263.1 hypothetical protein D5a_00361 [Faustovirus]AMN85250.1 hypothetical protein E23_00363 [Faustovirus]QBR99248.1 hypothetical protein [Faustovirus mariensis]
MCSRGAIKVVDPSEYKIRMSNYAYKPNGDNGDSLSSRQKGNYAPLVGQTKRAPKIALKRELTYSDDAEDANIALTYTNVQIDIGLCDNGSGVVRIRSFSDLKLPKIGQPQRITLPNGSKCVFYEKEIKCRMTTGSRIVSIIGKLFQGSQRPISKEPIITNIVPSVNQTNNMENTITQLGLVDLMSKIASYPSNIRYIYLVIMREIRKFNVEINIEDANFETSPVNSASGSSLSSPTSSQPSTPTSSPTSSISGVTFSAILANQTTPPAVSLSTSPNDTKYNHELIVIQSNATKPVPVQSVSAPPAEVKIKSFGHIYYINSRSETKEIKDCGTYADICPKY